MSTEPAYLAPSNANVEWSPYPEPVDWPIVIRMQHGDITVEQLRRLTKDELLAGCVMHDATPPEGVRYETFRTIAPDNAHARDAGYRGGGAAYERWVNEVCLLRFQPLKK